MSLSITYQDIYVFVEQRNGKIQSVGLELLGKARELADIIGCKVVAMLPGYSMEEQCRQLIVSGADKVVYAHSEYLKDYTTEPYTQAIAHMVKLYNPLILLMGATTIGRDLGPRLSARLKTGLTADCTRLEVTGDGDLLMTRPAFGGNLMATIICKDHRPQMSTVRPGVMKQAVPDTNREGEIEKLEIPFDTNAFKVRLIKKEEASQNKIDITQARILVSGGRGIGCSEGFEKLNELSKVLKAEVSASRAMVDAGFLPHERQVGQTGKTVRPDLYIALGISGAVQHLAGMEESDFIVAVNKDRNAPIFGVADVGIVGDVNKIVPLLTQRLKEIVKQ